MEELSSSSEEEKRTKKIKVGDINTDVAAENFAELLEDKKTYFLNGAWGSGKTKFIKNVEANSNKKFVYLDLWNIKDERTVINIAFTKLYPKLAFSIKVVAVVLISISILMTDVVNLGFEETLPLVFLKFAGVISVIVSVYHFLRVKSDQIYVYLLSKLNSFYKDKVLVIDDFDRVSEEKQEEAYKLFNILNGELTIVFLGDYTKIAKNEDNYLQKIIDRRIELPYDLHPKKIWGKYFKKLEEKLEFVMNFDLQNLFIKDKRNIREQHHFNDYVNLEFIEKGKSGHVQTNQQLLVIYLYLFNHKDYQNLLEDWEPDVLEDIEYEEQRTKGVFVRVDMEPREVKFESLKEELICNLLFVPKDFHNFRENKEAYFIQEKVSNMSLQEGEDILKNNKKLKKALVERGSNQEDFYQLVTEKYKEWFPYDVMSLTMHNFNKTKVKQSPEIENIEAVAFELLSENKESDLIHFIVQEIPKRNLSITSLINNKDPEHEDRAKRITDFFEKKYLEKFDLSQKIYFYSYEFAKFLYPKEIHRIFKNEIESVLNDDKTYNLQKRKASLLSLLTLKEEDLSWIYTAVWKSEIKAKVSDLEGADLLEFWTFMRLFKVDYKDKPSREISEVVKITVWEGEYEYEGGYKNYRDLFDFSLFEEKLETLSKEFAFKIERARVNELNFLKL